MRLLHLQQLLEIHLSAKYSAASLLRSYDNIVVFGGESDHEAALHTAINTTFTLASDERKAELYARLADRFWEEGSFGTVRRMFVMEELRRWNIDHVFGADLRKRQFNAIPYEGGDDE